MGTARALPASSQSFSRSTPVHVTFAALAMGAWAFFANRGHGPQEAGVAALAQGLMSGAITLGLKRALEAMAGRFGGALGYLAAPVLTAATILAVLSGVHLLAGTPNVAATIALPWSVSTLYAVIYAAALARGPR